MPLCRVLCGFFSINYTYLRKTHDRGEACAALTIVLSVSQESPKVTVLGADRPFEHLHTSSTADQKLIPPTTPYPDQRKTYTLYYPLPSTTPYTLYYPLPQNIHGAAPPRLSHPTAPPDPRQPYPTAPLPPRPHPKPPPPDAQPHRAAPPHAVPRGTRRSIHSDRPCPPTTSPSPQGASPI